MDKVFQQLPGKVIANVDNSAINVLIFIFTDGSRLEIEGERGPIGIITIVPTYLEPGLPDAGT